MRDGRQGSAHRMTGRKIKGQWLKDAKGWFFIEQFWF